MASLSYVLVQWILTVLTQVIHISGEEKALPSDSRPPITCRTERRYPLPFEAYKVDTCGKCYHYMPVWAFTSIKDKFMYNYGNALLTDPRTNLTYYADFENVSHPIFSTFSSRTFTVKWVSCCQAAVDCCLEMIHADPPQSVAPHCPRTWDGWQCWPDTPGGSVAKAICPQHVYFKSEPPGCPRYALKVCWPNGTWFLNKANREWTDYAGCGRVEEVRRLLYFHVATYSVSIFFLVPALVIFMIYKQLQVHRITMHKNLFVSLLVNAVVVILFKSIVMLDELDSSSQVKTLLEQNGVWCKILFILTKYFRMTNYMWMFCEGFYLHKLIAAAFAEQKNLIMFYIMGWVFPVIPVSIYAILRKILADEQCWAMPVESYEWIMNGPNLLSMVLNLAFLCNIIRVLVTKLRATHANEPSQYRKAVKATLVLVPLFGLHFCLVIYRPQSGECGVLEVYTFFSHALDGLQGFLVALIFCYMNGEVVYLMKRSYHRFQLHHGVRASSLAMSRMSMNTQASSVMDSQSPITTHHRITVKTNPVRNNRSDPCLEMVDGV